MASTSNGDPNAAGAAPQKKPRGPGSRRGIETMLRSAYRTNLDMTSLADNKANMLISVNSLILSVMIATGGLSIFAEASLIQIAPILSLAATSFVTMVFAILVARPRIDLSFRPTREDFERDRANPFLFSHYLNLPEGEYLELTRAVMNDRERLYRHMVAQNYGMGLVLARKFQLLRWSYNGFVTGLAISIVLLVVALFSGGGPA